MCDDFISPQSLYVGCTIVKFFNRVFFPLFHVFGNPKWYNYMNWNIEVRLIRCSWGVLVSFILTHDVISDYCYFPQKIADVKIVVDHQFLWLIHGGFSFSATLFVMEADLGYEDICCWCGWNLTIAFAVLLCGIYLFDLTAQGLRNVIV